jgi:hypothetical protein
MRRHRVRHRCCRQGALAGEHGADKEAGSSTMTSGAVTLGDIADKMTMLEVACSKCERRAGCGL